MPTAPKQFRLGPSKEQAAKQYDRRRGSAASRGYGTRWERYRRWYFSFPCNVLCGICERAPGVVLDHVQAISGPNDPLFWETWNHLGECVPCASRKTALCDGSFGHARTKEGAELLELLKRVARERWEAMKAV